MKIYPLTYIVACLTILFSLTAKLKADEPVVTDNPVTAGETAAADLPEVDEKGSGTDKPVAAKESSAMAPEAQQTEPQPPKPVPPKPVPRTDPRPQPKARPRTSLAPQLEERNWLEATYETLIEERLSIGARITSYSLSETERPPDPNQELTFLGNLNRLHSVSNNRIQPVVTYRICRYLALEYTQDRVSARTQNRDTDGTEGSYDGTVQLSGPIFSAMLRVPIYDRIIPYVGIGYASWSAKYIYEPWWHLGWGSPEQYDKAGRPGTSTGKIRHMYVEDDSATVLTLGLAIKLSRYAELDFMMRRMDLMSKAEFVAELGSEMRPLRSGDFPMKHRAYGAALSVIF